MHESRNKGLARRIAPHTMTLNGRLMEIMLSVFGTLGLAKAKDTGFWRKSNTSISGTHNSKYH